MLLLLLLLLLRLLLLVYLLLLLMLLLLILFLLRRYLWRLWWLRHLLLLGRSWWIIFKLIQIVVRDTRRCCCRCSIDNVCHNSVINKTHAQHSLQCSICERRACPQCICQLRRVLREQRGGRAKKLQQIWRRHLRQLRGNGVISL